MNRAALEHIIRAASVISGDDEIVVIGSQAVLASFPKIVGVDLLLERIAQINVDPRLLAAAAAVARSLA